MNIKLFLLLGIIILFYIYLLIKKHNKNKIIEENKKNSVKLSKFVKNYYDIENFKNLKDYETKFFKSGKLLDFLGIKSQDELNFDKITINLHKDVNYDIIIENNFDKINGCSGIVFDNSNDDLIVFDIAYLKRYQLRLDRKEFSDKQNIKFISQESRSIIEDNLLIFCFYIEKLLFLKEKRKSILIESLNNIVKDKNVYFDSYIKIKNELLSINSKKLKNLIDLYNNKIRNHFRTNTFETFYTRKNATEFNPIYIETGYYEYYSKIKKSLEYVINIKRYDYNNKDNLIKELQKLHHNYLIYENITKCFDQTDINKCRLKYNYNLPSFHLDKDNKSLNGLENLNFDYNNETLKHTYLLDDITKHTKRNMGVFQPFISDSNFENDDKLNIINFNYVYKNKFNNKEYKDKNVVLKKDEISETLGNPKIKETSTYVFLENTGIGMYYDYNVESIFVPDPINNRIQVLKCLPDSFIYNGEFGNLKYVTKRSLPTYKSTDKDSVLYNTYVSYEPIFNTNDNPEVRDSIGYRCLEYKKAINQKKSGTNFAKFNTDLYFRNIGPIDMFNIETNYNTKLGKFDNLTTLEKEQHVNLKLTLEDEVEIKGVGNTENINNYECEVEYSTRRANMNSRQKINNVFFKKGHFYHLLEEYKRVLDLADNSENKNYLNPHLLKVNPKIKSGYFEANIVSDPITNGSLAYRKLLLKYITETDIGQEFGQLFRPQAIFYDDDDLNFGGKKYYIVDTFHHCVQCFEQIKNTRTDKGEVLNFESADKKFNKFYDKLDNNIKKGYYLYDSDWNINDNYEKYNNSDILSLGVRQCILEFNTDMLKDPVHLNDKWAQKYGQTDFNGNATVKLYRWTSGITKKEDTDKYPFFYNEFIGDDENDTRRNFPGTGEFSYPTDILICKSPVNINKKYTIYNENIMFITDTGNNRISIFKKYKNKNDKYRFRFYKFLKDSKNLLINPISITKDNNDNLYILCMKKDNKNVIFKCNFNNFKSTRENKLLYEEPSLLIDNKNFINSVKIRIDSRNILAISGNNTVKIELNKLNDEIKNKISKETKLILYKSGIGFKLNIQLPFTQNFFIKRYRLLINRINKSKNINDIILSREYKYDKKIDNNSILFIDKINKKDDKEHYWVKYNYGIKTLLGNDIYDDNKGHISELLNKDIKKIYSEYKYNFNDKEITNINLDGVEDYIPKNLYPNSSYKYEINLIDYSNIIKFDTILNLDILPLGIPNNLIFKRFIYRPGRGEIKFTLNYGSISNLHLETMKYNPLSVYIFKSKHSRSMNITNKYVNLNKGQMIQLIVPKESKFILDKFSKPKFGKLYVNDVFDFGNITETRKEMKENFSYGESNISIYYLANEGNFEIPKYDKESGIEYIDDYFVLGNNTNTFYTKIKYRVRIYLENENSNIIKFDNPNTILSNLEYYNRERGLIDETSLSFVDEIPLWEKTEGYNNNKGTVEIIDNTTSGINENGNLERNQTYEYHIFVGNDKIINNGINSFYYTTKSNIYIDSISSKFENLIVNGVKKNFIRLKWYCSKYKNSYLPYNFFIMRRQIKTINNKSPPTVISFKDKMDKFLVNKNGSIILKPNSENSDFNKTVDLKKVSKYRIKFNPFNTNEQYKKKIKFVIYENNIKLKSDTFNWAYDKRYYDFKGNIINININLTNTDILNPFKIVEILDESDYQEDDIMPRRDEPNNNINGETVNLTLDELELFNRYKTSQEIGLVFTLEDESFNPKINTNPNKLMGYNFNGYTSDLYLYLNQLNHKELLEIFDNLKEKVAINAQEVNMRMDGSSGMLRSGGRDMLIDKIRYLAYIVRDNKKKEQGIVNCENIKLTDLFNNQDKTLNCKSDDLLTQENEQKTKMEEYNKKLLKNKQQKSEMIKKQIEESNKRIEDTKLLEEINKSIEDLNKDIDKINKEKNQFEIEQERIKRNIGNEDKKLYSSEIVDIFNDKVLKDTSNSYLKMKKMILNRRYRGSSVKLENFVNCEPDNCAYPFVFKSLDNFLTVDLINTLKKLDDLDMGFREVDFLTFEFINIGDANNIKPENIIIYMKAYSNISENDFNDNLVEDGNTVLIYREQFENKLNKTKEEYNKQLEFLKKEKEKYKYLGSDNVDIKRLISQEEKLNDLLNEDLKNSKLSEWTFLKDGYKELSFEEPLTDKTKLNILKYYSIKPDLVSLNNKTDTIVKKEDLKGLNLITYTQLIEVTDKNNYQYEYRIVSFPTGINLLDHKIKDFYGVDYKTRYATDLPLLGLGEFYSEKMILGDNVVNIVQEEIKEEIPVKIPMIKSKKPIIKFFEPKRGSENSIIKIVGINLDDLEYICMRDIKVKILKKNKRFIKENNKFNSYDEFIIKPPSLKELNKECWQSLEPYRVLIWGYYNKLGLQIRTDEKGDKNMFFTYTDRKECPKEERLTIPK